MRSRAFIWTVATVVLGSPAFAEPGLLPRSAPARWSVRTSVQPLRAAEMRVALDGDAAGDVRAPPTAAPLPWLERRPASAAVLASVAAFVAASAAGLWARVRRVPAGPGRCETELAPAVFATDLEAPEGDARPPSFLADWRELDCPCSDLGPDEEAEDPRSTAAGETKAAPRSARSGDVRASAADQEALLDAGDKEAMLDALNAPLEPSVDYDTPSHTRVNLDEDGQPVRARFVYVDEHSCIGCTYCASVARSTFSLEDDHGRARVFDQEGDNEETVAEAIDSCPVNCIHFVSYEDLTILETEREGQVINNQSRLVSQQEATAFAPATAAKGFDSGFRCNNCPGRGCKDCPMFGVGENPVYLERMREREERKQRSGEAAAEEAAKERAAIIDDFFASPEVDVVLGQDPSAAADTALDALFAEPDFAAMEDAAEEARGDWQTP